MDIPTACTIDEALELQQELLLLQMQWQSNHTYFLCVYYRTLFVPYVYSDKNLAFAEA